MLDGVFEQIGEHDALEADQQAIRLILSDDPQPSPLAYQRMRVNQAHNALFNSLNQAMLISQ